MGIDEGLLPDSTEQQGDLGCLNLAEIIDAREIQSLMDDFYRLAHIPMSLNDLQGRVLVGVGWQEICTRFHRQHPATCENCLESDTRLASGVPEGEFKLYKCKNNMWDVVTPLMVGGKHNGNLFMGQFFFDDEQSDYELFRQQAARCGFDEAEYMAALVAVPRLSRKSVETGMAYLMKLAAMISRLSYGNIRLARSLAERDALMDSLQKSQQQNQFLANIIRHAAQPFGQSFPDGSLGLTNNAFEQLTGYMGDELESIDWTRTLTPPELLEFDQEKLDDLERTGKPIRYEKEYIRKDGSRVPIELLVHSVNDLEGNLQYYYSFITDISERKRAEKEIARRNALLTGINTIFREALTCDTHEMLAEVCLKVAGAITGSLFGFIGEIGRDGYFHDIAISETGWEACAMYDRSGNRRPPGNFHIQGVYGRVLLDGKSFFTNDPASHPESVGVPDGHPPLTSFLGVPLRCGGTTIGMIAVGNRAGGYSKEELESLEALAPAVVQAFQRKQAEEALKKLNEELEKRVAERTAELEFKNVVLSTQKETSIDGILIVDEGNCIISHNQRFVELWSIPQEMMAAEDVTPVVELIASKVADREGFLERVSFLYGHREEKSREEILLTDGREFERYSAPMLGSDGKYFGRVWYFRDISERQETRRALLEETVERLRAVEKLREKDQMLVHQSRQAAMGEMIGNIAHQWRQPLNSLGLTVQKMLLYFDRAELNRECLDKCVVQSMSLIRHMSRTIDDFSNFFRPDKERVNFKVVEAVANTVALVEGSFKNQRIGIEVVAQKDPVVNGYRNEFVQVILNILNNAKDVLTERGTREPRVTISVNSDNDRHVVTISDNAGGIPEEIMDRIFDPYFTTKGHRSGTGVGLFMSKTIIEKNMGGSLTASNIPQGAEFRIVV